MNSPESPPWGFLQWAVAAIGLDRSERCRICLATYDSGFTLSRLPFGNTNTISTYRSRRMNLRSWSC